MSETRKILRLTVSGRVQGVGFRAYVAHGAARLGLAGWTRNRGYDQVETVATGGETALAEFVALVRRGPPSARVDRFELKDADEADLALAEDDGFVVLPSV